MLSRAEMVAITDKEVTNMADTKTTPAKTEEKKGYRITKEVEEYLVKIEKNLAFAKENKCEDEFKEGGKYYGAFMRLIKEAAVCAGTQLRDAMQATLPAPERRPEFKEVVKKLQATALNNGFKDLCNAFSTADEKEIRTVYRQIYGNYCDAYSKQVMPIKDLVA